MSVRVIDHGSRPDPPWIARERLQPHRDPSGCPMVLLLTSPIGDPKSLAATPIHVDRSDESLLSQSEERDSRAGH